ncbi:MAG: hypothetical protein KC621_24180 [Myxococcales bacterium]|nr:hypothetical protein [Myxococcales bacterium]
MRRFALVSLLPLVAACDLSALTGASGTETTTGSATDSASTPTVVTTTSWTDTTSATPLLETDSGDQEGWSFSQHPCTGNRADTMWLDDEDTIWLGCGSTSDGTGLYLSLDGGRSWGTPRTSPAGWFDTFRVSSISRSADGLLYVAGTDTASSARVVSMDAAGQLGEVLDAGTQLGTSFHVGTFRRNSAGVAVAESLTGPDVLARLDDGERFEDARTGTAGRQILDLVLFEDEFYAVGSTISQPPTIFLPPQDGVDAGTGFRFDVVEFRADGLYGFDGELWGLDVDEGGLVAAGVNQDRGHGIVLWADDPQDLAGYQMLDLGGRYGEPTWMRGACRDGATMVAVGEFSRLGEGLVLRSDDGGATWDDITPDRLPPVQRCALLEDGSLMVAGGEGLFARLDD